MTQLLAVDDRIFVRLRQRAKADAQHDRHLPLLDVAQALAAAMRLAHHLDMATQHQTKRLDTAAAESPRSQWATALAARYATALVRVRDIALAYDSPLFIRAIVWARSQVPLVPPPSSFDLNHNNADNIV
jgi:hypothetical protein